MAASAKDILARIDQRLSETGCSESRACANAGTIDAVKNMRRAVMRGREYNMGIGTIEKLAPVLGTTVDWLLHGNAQNRLVNESEAFAHAHLEIRAWSLMQGRTTKELRRIIATIEAAFPRNIEGGDQ